MLCSREEADDDLSELQSDAVPDEVRKWLASTFAKQEETVQRQVRINSSLWTVSQQNSGLCRQGERPSFRSVANAIRTGIFIDKIYRGMSHGTQMEIPAEIQAKLKVGVLLLS